MDLLGTHSIPELRQLVGDIEKDAVNKKNDLQLMVGSKYHDFISSADRISEMKSETEYIENQLISVIQANQSVVTSCQHLLSLTLGDSNADSESKDSKFNSFNNLNIDSSVIWNYLSDCKIFEATKSLVISQLVLSVLKGEKVKKLPVEKFVSKKALDSLMKSRKTVINRNKLRSACFLRDTIAEDARLMLLLDADLFRGFDATEKAKALTALSLLGGQTIGATKIELLNIYLECASCRLQHALSSLTHNIDPSDDDSTSIDLEKSLSRVVQLLQEVVMDVYLAFQDNAEIHVGMLSLLRTTMLQSILDPTYSSSNLSSLFDLEAFSVNFSSPSSQLKRTVQTWLSSSLTAVTERTKEVLTDITSAMDVARLQQHVWLCCTSLTSSASLPKSTYCQQLWEESCAQMLQTGKTSSSSNEMTASGNLLWSSTFRVSFLHQVERLLRSSCQDVLSRTKKMLLFTLSAEGLAVDPDSLTVEFKDSSSDKDREKNVNPNTTSSSTLYVLADRIQHEFEDSIFSLLDDIITPMRDGGDPQSSSALSKALKVQCAHLIGQFFVFVRCVSESCRDALIKRGFLSSDLQNLSRRMESKSSPCSEPLVSLIKKTCTSRTTSSVYKYHHGSSGGSVSKREMSTLDLSLLSGLLLMGRVCWLFRIRSSFLEFALELQTSDNADSNFELNSEDQFRSAFEIADTDGDGVLTYPEALEAIQALAVSDNNNGTINDGDEENNVSESLAVFYGLSPVLTPSLTYSEFALICGSQLLTRSVFQPLERVCDAIDNLIVFSHIIWAVATVQSAGTSLLDDVGKDLCLDLLDVSDRKKLMIEKSFKISWVSKMVDLEEDSGSSEKMLVPAACNAFLGKFLFNINNALMVASVSVDTMQRIPSKNIENCLLNRLGCSDPILSSLAAKLLTELALQEVLYMFDLFMSRIEKSSNVSDIVEEASMQVIFDLMICNSMQVSNKKGVPSNLSKWRECLDPITAEIVMPLVERSVRDFTQSIALIYPCLSSTTAKTDNALDTTVDMPKNNIESHSSLFPVHFKSAISSLNTRFSLLPLAISTSSQTRSSQNNKNKNKTTNAGLSNKQSNNSKTSSTNASNWW